jgi:hypothetical protein
MNLLTKTWTAGKLYRIGSLVGALAAVGSCQSDQGSLTGVPRPVGPPAAAAVASTTNISPTADTYLNLDALSHASEATLNLYTWPDGKIANATLMKFDVASIPAGSTISSATLNLYLIESDATADATYAVTVHKVVNKTADPGAATGYTYDGVNEWTSNNCCFNNVPLAQADISVPVSTNSVNKTPGFKQWDVTSIVQEWFSNPSTNFGLLVNSDPSKPADHWRFFSSTEGAVDQRPYLTVVYTSSSTPGTVTDLSVASVTSNSATLSFTEVDDGTGQPAKYNVRYAVAPIAWGSATDVTQGTCATPVLGTAIGASRTCTVAGLASSTTYDFQLVAYRGTLNQDAVFGGLSNVAQGTTASGGGGVVFESNWSTELGTSPAAFTDGGRWDEWSDAGFNTPDGPIMTVVASGPNATYPNALRVQQRGGCDDCWADVRKNPFIATGNTDYYLRFYFMTADVGGAPFGDHGVEPWITAGQYEDIVYLSKLEGPTGWGIKMRIGGNGPRLGPYDDPRYPVGNWFLTTSENGPPPLSYNTWYRLEYWVHFTSTNHMQVHPRVYTASGTEPLYQDADFVQEGYGSASDCGGVNDWTLERWYSRIIASCNPGGDFEVNLHPAPEQAGTTLQSLVMGNNGAFGTTDTRLFWYYAGVRIRTDTWPGP